MLTTPLVRCLKRQTGAEIHYLTKSEYKPLLEANIYIDKLFSIEKSVSEVLPELKKEAYSCIIDLHKNLRSFLVKTSLNCKTHSFNKLNLEKWLFVNFKLNFLPKISIVDRYMQTVSLFNVTNDGAGLDYFFPKDFETKVEVELHTSFQKESNYIAFCIGAAHQTKRMPTKKLAEICRSIESPIVLLGGKEQEMDGETLVKDSGRHLVNLCGKTALHQSAAIIKGAKVVVTHDTGMMHIATAFQKPIISIWGSTVPDFGMYPYYKIGVERNTTFEVTGLSCRPCSKIGFEKCPKGHFKCMQEIDTGALIEKLRAMMDG
jgi:ADP-heptose:LPS heptosyltransferase